MGRRVRFCFSYIKSSTNLVAYSKNREKEKNMFLQSRELKEAKVQNEKFSIIWGYRERSSS